MYSPQTSFAFEDVVAAVREADTVSYTTVITPKNGPASQTKTYHKGSLTHTVFADGSYSVMDMDGQKLLMVQPALKTATLTHLGSKPENLPTMGESIIGWLKTAETTGKAVGEKTIHGVRTLGFECAFGATTMTLWGDPKTKLPVQIEATIGSPSEPIQMVMREFDFNAALDDEDALFSTEVPAGFQTQETKQLAIDYAALAKLKPEEHLVRILKFYAKLHDGAFPERRPPCHRQGAQRRAVRQSAPGKNPAAAKVREKISGPDGIPPDPKNGLGTFSPYPAKAC